MIRYGAARRAIPLAPDTASRSIGSASTRAGRDCAGGAGAGAGGAGAGQAAPVRGRRCDGSGRCHRLDGFGLGNRRDSHRRILGIRRSGLCGRHAGRWLGHEAGSARGIGSVSAMGGGIGAGAGGGGVVSATGGEIGAGAGGGGAVSATGAGIGAAGAAAAEERPAGTPRAAIVWARQSANCFTSLPLTSAIMPRPNWAARPAMSRSATTLTRVVAPLSRLVQLTAVTRAWAPPPPRLSCPDAMMTTRSVRLVPLDEPPGAPVGQADRPELHLHDR